jgi:hypothetical protein
MNARVASLAASLAVSLLMVAGATAFARQATKSAATKPAHVTHAEAPSAKGTASAKGAAAAKSTHAALPPALAAIPEADRLAIQADLAWLGHFEGLSAEEIGARTLDAIKAFQRRNGGKETGVLSDQERVSLAEAARPHEATVGWRLIDDSATAGRRAGETRAAGEHGPHRQPLDLAARPSPDRKFRPARRLVAGLVRTGEKDVATASRLQRA